MPSRRTFLLSTGALATTGIAATGTARRAKQAPSRDEINEAFRRGVASDGADGARANLEDLGLDPQVSETSNFQFHEKEADTKRASESTASAQWTYEDPDGGDSKLVTSLTDLDSWKDGDVVLSVAMHLDGCNAALRNSWWVDDAIGIGYKDQDWAPVGEPSVSVDSPHSAKFTEEDVSDDALAGTIDTYRDYNDARCDTLPEATASLTGEFKLRPGGVKSTLWGSYTHTVAASPSGVIEGIEGGRGGISVSLSFSASKAWSIAKPEDPR